MRGVVARLVLATAMWVPLVVYADGTASDDRLLFTPGYVVPAGQRVLSLLVDNESATQPAVFYSQQIKYDIQADNLQFRTGLTDADELSVGLGYLPLDRAYYPDGSVWSRTGSKVSPRLSYSHRFGVRGAAHNVLAGVAIYRNGGGASPNTYVEPFITFQWQPVSSVSLYAGDRYYNASGEAWVSGYYSYWGTVAADPDDPESDALSKNDLFAGALWAAADRLALDVQVTHRVVDAPGGANTSHVDRLTLAGHIRLGAFRYVSLRFLSAKASSAGYFDTTTTTSGVAAELAYGF